MGERTGIAWCDHTFNPWWGCTKVSPGCKFCYAERVAAFRNAPGLWGPQAERRTFGADHHWRGPWRWNARAERDGVRRRVFCGSMCDVFEDFPGLEAERSKLWDVIYRTHSLDWLLLTKRPENIDRMSGVTGLPGVWIGTSVEDQERANQRIPILGRQTAVVRFLSVEPMIGPVDLTGLVGREVRGMGFGVPPAAGTSVDWVIIGGESQAGCRPMKVEWVESLMAQCRDLGIAVFVKQLGGHPDKRDDPRRWPEHLRVQEFPVVKLNLHPEQRKIWEERQ